MALCEDSRRQVPLVGLHRRLFRDAEKLGIHGHPGLYPCRHVARVRLIAHAWHANAR